MLAGLAIGIKQHVLKSKPIKYVRTEGSFQYLVKEDVKNALLPLVNRGFFDADMQAIQQAVGNLTWVESVTVKRVWPDAIDIKVREKKPYVRWRQNSLVDTKGQIIEPKSIEPFSSLLLVHGPDQQQVKVLEIMKGVKTALADKALELAE
ncbi:MAG: FtsQ-type POTRA domain-containing protein, partial [Methylococcaceae bacterium]|nr:FtsQ-type POTRA domain-containing protein [Methylococcaceae bacterium]